jgi:hypothetical protein
MLLTLVLNKKKFMRLMNLNKNLKMPSNKKFGWFFSITLAMIAIYCYWKKLNYFSAATAIITLLFLTITVLAPKFLTPLNRNWYLLGVILGKIISPIVLGVMFFVFITPISIFMRIFGRDELKIKKSFVQSYWVDRLPPGPPSESFKNQF